MFGIDPVFPRGVLDRFEALFQCLQSRRVQFLIVEIGPQLGETLVDLYERPIEHLPRFVEGLIQRQQGGETLAVAGQQAAQGGSYNFV